MYNIFCSRPFRLLDPPKSCRGCLSNTRYGLPYLLAETKRLAKVIRIVIWRLVKSERPVLQIRTTLASNLDRKQVSGKAGIGPSSMKASLFGWSGWATERRCYHELRLLAAAVGVGIDIHPPRRTTVYVAQNERGRSCVKRVLRCRSFFCRSRTLK
jgi:hypothetical protein